MEPLHPLESARFIKFVAGKQWTRSQLAKALFDAGIAVTHASWQTTRSRLYAWSSNYPNPRRRKLPDGWRPFIESVLGESLENIVSDH